MEVVTLVHPENAVETMLSLVVEHRRCKDKGLEKSTKHCELIMSLVWTRLTASERKMFEELGQMLRAPKEVYAFEWCDCVHESAYGVESMHTTKVGAYRAMRKYLWDKAVEARDEQLQGYGLGRGRKMLMFEAWRVRRIVLET